MTTEKLNLVHDIIIRFKYQLEKEEATDQLGCDIICGDLFPFWLEWVVLNLHRWWHLNDGLFLLIGGVQGHLLGDHWDLRCDGGLLHCGCILPSCGILKIKPKKNFFYYLRAVYSQSIKMRMRSYISVVLIFIHLWLMREYRYSVMQCFKVTKGCLNPRRIGNLTFLMFRPLSPPNSIGYLSYIEEVKSVGAVLVTWHTCLTLSHRDSWASLASIDVWKVQCLKRVPLHCFHS